MKKKGFVCQSCGNMVPPNTDRCPHCGKFFKGVRCPQCLYVGVSSDFVHGCPSCGFLSDEKSRENDKNGSILPGREKKSEKTFPGWFYLISAAILAVLVIIFLVMIFRS